MNLKRWTARLRRKSDDIPYLGEPAPDLSDDIPARLFEDWAASLGADACVLEVGTRQTNEGVPTHFHRDFPNVPRSRYLMADVRPGIDVDVVADLHALPDDWSERFDGFVASAVMEHLERPWIAAREIARVLKPGGRCYLATHQTFPLHGHPSDFFRFSKEALALLFEDAGIETLAVAYQHRVKITPPSDSVAPHLVDEWNRVWPSYLLVALFGRKPE